MQVRNVVYAARWKYRTQKSQFWNHRTTLSGCIFAAKTFINNRRKNLLNSNTSSTCPYNMVNFGLLTAEICWRVWDTPANFNRFRVLAASLHGTLVVGVSQALRRQPNFAALNRGRHLYLAGRPSHILVRVRLKRLITFCIVIAKIPKISYPWNVKLVANLRIDITSLM